MRWKVKYGKHDSESYLNDYMSLRFRMYVYVDLDL